MKHTLSTLLAIPLLAVGVSHAANMGPVSVHGTFSQGYIDSDNNNFIEDSEDGTFDFREYGINGIWDVCDKLQVSAQVFDREYGTVGNDDPYLDLAYVDYRPADAFGIRAGKMKIPNGLYNETREIDALRTEILLPSAVYMELARDTMSAVIGVGLYGDIDMKSLGTLSYYVQYGQRQIDEDDGDFARIVDEIYLTIDDVDMGDSYSAKLGWTTPVEGLELATTYSTESMDLTGTQDVGQYAAWEAGVPSDYLSASSYLLPVTLDLEHIDAWVFSAEYTKGNMVLVSELSKLTYTSMEYLPGGGPGQPGSGDILGYYVKAGYRWSKLLDTAIGYSTTEDVFTDTDAHDSYISLRFDLTENLILKLEEHLIHGTAGLFNRENPDGIDDDSNVFLAKTTLYF